MSVVVSSLVVCRCVCGLRNDDSDTLCVAAQLHSRHHHVTWLLHYVLLQLRCTWASLITSIVSSCNLHQCPCSQPGRLSVYRVAGNACPVCMWPHRLSLLLNSPVVTECILIVECEVLVSVICDAASCVESALLLYYVHKYLSLMQFSELLSCALLYYR